MGLGVLGKDSGVQLDPQIYTPRDLQIESSATRVQCRCHYLVYEGQLQVSQVCQCLLPRSARELLFILVVLE